MPHLKKLVELHQDDPFALIGINSNDSESAYRKGREKHGMTWLSVYQGAPDAISKMYKVRGYPTMVLVDYEGEIVTRNARGDELDRLIEKEIRRAKAASK